MNDFANYRALSFDCYGTLIDWESGIAAALRPWAAAHGLDLDDEALVAAHARHESVVQREDPAGLYPAVLAETMRRIGMELGAPVSETDAARYGASIAEWPAFPDSAAVLATLAERFKLIILSNVDRRSFAASNRRLRVEFDLIVTAEDVGSYKPALANFEFMFARLASLDVRRAELLHVAESLYHDHEPASRIGLDSVWIHRRHDRTGFGATAPPTNPVVPRWRFTSLVDFAAAVAG